VTYELGSVRHHSHFAASHMERGLQDIGARRMTVKNSKEFVQLVSNRLGWLPEEPYSSKMGIEAKKVTNKMGLDPDLYTFSNLELAVEYCWDKRIPESPLGVFKYIKPALRGAVEATGETARIGDVDEWPEAWRTRYIRALPHVRNEVVVEYWKWKQEKNF
jgi:hypothetical protein